MYIHKNIKSFLNESKEKHIKDAGEFVDFSGAFMDENAKKLKKFKIEPDDDNGMFDTDRLDELKKLVEKHPELHIITQVEQENTICYDNSIAMVDRVGYFLGDGSKEPAYCEEEMGEDTDD